MDYPLVSCLCPTYNRRAFMPRCVRCFLSQDYPNLEFIVLDDSNESVQDLLPLDPRIKYHYEPPKRAHSPKINRCCELAAGEFLIIWDDDDFYAPSRVRLQIEPLIANPNVKVSGMKTFYYYDKSIPRAYRWDDQMVPWIGAIAFRRSAWEEMKFDDDFQPGGDNRWLQKVPRASWHEIVDNPGLVVASIHSTNDCKKHITNSYKEVPWETIQQATNGDL